MPASSRSALPPRSLVALVSGKLLGVASRRLGRGGGTALPGVVAERIDPTLSRRLALQLGGGRAIVTGTNGKTTTARMLADVATGAGALPVHNRSGSNLMRGIATTLLGAADGWGWIAGGRRRAGVFEVDEATLPHAVRTLRPRAVLFTNLFRDQLDRYGEVDAILALWRESLELLPAATTIVLNADDPSVAGLADGFEGDVLFYGVDAEGTGGVDAGAEHAADARWCHACGSEYVYAPLYFGHIGRWRCPGCGRRRPEPQVRALDLRPYGGGTRVTVDAPGGRVTFDLPLAGLYNVYNATAAFAGAVSLGLPHAAIPGALAAFSAAFGRQERVDVESREVRILLCKNPAGTNQAIASLLDDSASSDAPLHLLVALNDGVQDGRDVSWIWDVDFERLAGRTASIIATGTRAADMGVRLKYAGLGGPLAVMRSQEAALDRALRQTPVGGVLIVLPTYTAMMSLREMIAARGGRGAFWQQ